MKAPTDIMIVDDFLEDRFFLSHLLSSLFDNPQITEFAYAEDALDHLKTNPTAAYDLLFVDINMLRMNGFEFADTYLSLLPEGQPAGKLFLVSGTFDPNDEARAHDREGVAGFIKKPVTRETLAAIIG
ncbi:response regulator [Yoonia sp. BS5-3]|uniref:Response regulator n=1 Tax=Yoonia phaeophyticola TaxID=3137369 RepID=A0ABZ2V552_9RHOB